MTWNVITAIATVISTAAYILTVLDSRQPAQLSQVPMALPQAVWIPVGEIEDCYGELPPEREIVVYCA